MNLRCFVVDDHITAAEHIGRYVKRAGLELLGIETDAIKALELIKSMNEKPDLVFLDISMPGMDGIEIAEELMDQTMIIFTTAHRAYAPESYKLNVLYYLLKPVSYEDFLKGIDKAVLFMQAKSNASRANKEFFTLPGNGKGSIIRIKREDIIYLKSAEHYVEIFTDTKKYMVHKSMKSMLTDLGGMPFIRVHKSYAVNIHHVIELKGNIIHLSGGFKADLGTNFRSDFLKYL